MSAVVLIWLIGGDASCQSPLDVSSWFSVDYLVHFQMVTEVRYESSIVDVTSNMNSVCWRAIHPRFWQ